MSRNGQILEQILVQVRNLPPEDRLRLIQQVAATLLTTPADTPPVALVYGRFAGESMSTEEDFSIAEWRPSEKDMNGS